MEDRAGLLAQGLAQMIAKVHNPEEIMTYYGLISVLDRHGTPSLQYMRRCASPWRGSSCSCLLFVTYVVESQNHLVGPYAAYLYMAVLDCRSHYNIWLNPLSTRSSALNKQSFLDCHTAHATVKQQTFFLIMSIWHIRYHWLQPGGLRSATIFVFYPATISGTTSRHLANEEPEKKFKRAKRVRSDVPTTVKKASAGKATAIVATEVAARCGRTICENCEETAATLHCPKCECLFCGHCARTIHTSRAMKKHQLAPTGAMVAASLDGAIGDSVPLSEAMITLGGEDAPHCRIAPAGNINGATAARNTELSLSSCEDESFEILLSTLLDDADPDALGLL